MHVIIGGNGVLGQDLIQQLQGEEIFVIDKQINEHGDYPQLQLNVSDVSAIASLDLSELSKIKKVSILTGINYAKGLMDIQFQEWEDMFAVNIRGTLFLIQKLLHYMADKGSIVLCSSQNGVVGHENRIGYGESKAALIHLAKNLTVEFAKMKQRDLRVNVVSPSYILNEKTKQYLTSTLQGQCLRAKIPNQTFITNESVIASILFLHQDSTAGIRGQNIMIDNGMTII
ncbi:SDR family NAD(P)-dependent oxidoreductase [Enterococcus faecalis]|uniref:SDR family NAD(P)-dependent oxidoreductase n=1 Tax=Enterococcus faecalis TaxID=1351 RepID=UPI003D14060F